MTFYEQELRKLFADGTVIGSPKFTGRACLGTLGKDLRARVQFVTSGHATTMTSSALRCWTAQTA